MFPHYLIICPFQNFQIGLFMNLAQIPSLDGEGAEGGWGDIKSVSNKSRL